MTRSPRSFCNFANFMLRCLLAERLSRRPSPFRSLGSGRKRSVIDGPLTEAKELIAGYTLIQVKPEQEAFEWSTSASGPSAGNADSIT